jgi:hypothetical protein
VRSGFTRHLGKPVAHDALVEAIASVAGQRAGE